MSTPTTVPEDVEGPITQIDLTDLSAHLEHRHAERFSEEHVIDWLRTSGGPLAEQIMKRAAADAIERYRSAAQTSR